MSGSRPSDPERAKPGASWLFELWLAARYFRTTRDDALIGLLSKITAGGLALGVASLILALAALSGFQQRLLGEVRARSPSLQVALDQGTDVAALERVVDALDGVVLYQQVVYGAGWLPRAGEVSPVEVIGYEKKLPVWLPEASFVEAAGAAGRVPETRGIVLPSDLARRWLLELGDVIEIVSPRSTLTPIGPQPRSRRLPLIALHDPGGADQRYSERVAMPLDLALGLVGGGDRWLDLTLAPGIEDRRTRAALESALGARADLATLEVRSWRDVHRALLLVLRLEKTAVFLAVVLIVLVASFALIAALSSILASKRAEIGILSAMGTTPRRIRRLFLLLGGLLAIGGTASGGAVGVLMALGLERFELIRLPSDVYIVDHVPFAVRGVDLLVVLLSASTVTVVAAVLGSRRSSLLDPVEALRQ